MVGFERHDAIVRQNLKTPMKRLIQETVTALKGHVRQARFPWKPGKTVSFSIPRWKNHVWQAPVHDGKGFEGNKCSSFDNNNYKLMNI